MIGEETVDEVLAVLRDDGTQMPKNWNRRFKHNRDKIKTGDIFELAEVVRNLSIRDLDKGLSTGEKQMFGRAKKILASELMYARDMEEQEAIDFLEQPPRGHRPSRSRRRGRERAAAQRRWWTSRADGYRYGKGGAAAGDDGKGTGGMTGSRRASRAPEVEPRC